MTGGGPARSHWCDRCKIAHSACSACGGLTDGGYDAHRDSHHCCDSAGSTAPAEDRVYVEARPGEAVLQDAPEVWDSCNGCGGLWVRFGKGPRLDMTTRQLHACPDPAQVAPPRMPDPPNQVSVEPPARWPEPARETKFL